MVAILSPSVMMGIERDNPDLLILALVGAAALIYQEQSKGRTCWTVALLGVIGVRYYLLALYLCCLWPI